MAWYNPIDWLKTGFKLGSDKLYNDLSMGSQAAGFAASIVGADSVAQTARDTSNFAESAKYYDLTKGFLKGDFTNTFTAGAYSKSAGDTAEERAAESAESHRLTSSTQEIAANTETAIMTYGQAVAAAAAAPFGPSASVAAAQVVEGAVDMGLALNGEAPTRSLVKTYSPLTGDYGATGNFALGLIGVKADPHYASGGTVDTHPESRFAVTNNDVAQYAAANQAYPEGFFSKLWSGIKGVFAAIINGIKKLLSGSEPAGASPATTYAAQPNHPRSGESSMDIVPPSFGREQQTTNLVAR